MWISESVLTMVSEAEPVMRGRPHVYSDARDVGSVIASMSRVVAAMPGRGLRIRHSRIYLPSGNRTAQSADENPCVSGSFASSSEQLDILGSDQHVPIARQQDSTLDATPDIPGIVAGRVATSQ